MQRNYEILHKNKIVAIWQNNNLQIIDNTFLPYFLKRNSRADEWLATRAIDCHRPNSRLLKKALRVTESEDADVVLRANGVTLTDNYWVREIGSELSYEDVRFKNDYFSKIASNLALYGGHHRFNNVATHKEKAYTELTNIGSFEKCWRYDDSEKSWFLYKVANHSEQFSEVFISRLGNALGIDVAEYSKKEGIVISKDFSQNASIDFEPAFYFVGDEEDYEYNYEVLSRLCPSAIKGYVQMIFIDVLVANPDRHTGNYGLFKDVDTGEYIGFSPLFDHNMALISQGYPKSTAVNKKDILIDLFVEFVKNHEDCIEYIPQLEPSTVDRIIDEVNIRVRKSFVSEYVMNRYKSIIEKIY